MSFDDILTHYEDAIIRNSSIGFNEHTILMSHEGVSAICLKCGRSVKEEDKKGAEQLFLLSHFLSGCEMSDAAKDEQVGRKLISKMLRKRIEDELLGDNGKKLI